MVGYAPTPSFMGVNIMGEEKERDYLKTLLIDTIKNIQDVEFLKYLFVFIQKKVK